MDLAEMIVYQGDVTALAGVRNKIESYLAIKYGITLDQTTAQNYTLSGGQVAWDATIAGSYKNNIAGIARDDATSLNQIKSQSITNTGDVIIENLAGSFATDKQSLMWANNGSDTLSWTGVETPSIASLTMQKAAYYRISREWQIQENNGDI